MPILAEHKELLLTQSESKTLPQEQNYTIYMHINKINKKVYIGQTKQQVEKRWNRGHGYAQQPYFYKAIKKYGWDNFEHKILESDIKTLEEANAREIYWIKYYDSTNSEKGYNISHGGVDEKQLQMVHEGWRKWRQNNPEQYEKNLKNMQNARVRLCSIAVHNIELDKVYYSAGEAGRQTNTDQSGIIKCCKGKQKTAGGYHWEYANK